ncbi:MAG: hypothetical protein ACK5QK_00635, partial [Chryseotalea sp.]
INQFFFKIICVYLKSILPLSINVFMNRDNSKQQPIKIETGLILVYGYKAFVKIDNKLIECFVSCEKFREGKVCAYVSNEKGIFCYTDSIDKENILTESQA